MKSFGCIGLTGGISCGKSTVSKILTEDYNAIIIDADKIARELCEPGEIIHSALKLGFTAERNYKKYFNKDGTLNRKALADLMFRDKEAKKSIEQMMHRYIKIETILKAGNAFMEEYQKEVKRPIVLDIPLLFEAKMEDLVLKTIVVHLDPKEQLRRLMERNNLSKEDALIRIHAQMEPYERLIRSDFILDNNGTIDNLKNGIDRIMNKLGYSKNQ
ncbi:MAG: dephospho-CoA kinase [Bacillales bacterium]|jgi:dephospho-CoA kinase|nr:dephospho-CoA kinase [Bacillales bacterium]